MSSEVHYALHFNFSISNNSPQLDTKESSYPIKAVLVRIFQLSIARHRNFSCWIFGRLLSHFTFLLYQKKQVSVGSGIYWVIWIRIFYV